MYALVILDERAGRTLAARDPFGIKPLYWARLGSTSVYASTIKSLLGVGAEDISPVLPGAVIEGDGPPPSSPHRSPSPPSIEISMPVAGCELRRLLSQSVRSMVDTDLTVAVLCSGGIDSSAVLYEAACSGVDVVAYSIGTSPSATDVSAARFVAAKLGVPFRPVIVSPDAVLASIPDAINAIESFEPNHIRGGAFSYLLARAVHEDGIKLAICGEGADELLGGYPEFQELDGDCDFTSSVKEKSMRFVSELHKTQLQRVDRTSMSWAVEVRVPYLDLDFTTFSLALPSDLKLVRTLDGGFVAKAVLREAYRGLLPNQTVERPKIVLSDGAGMGDNSPAGPFYEYAHSQMSDADFERVRSSYPEFGLRDKEEAYYFSRFVRTYGALRLAAERPHVNTLPTKG